MAAKKKAARATEVPTQYAVIITDPKTGDFSVRVSEDGEVELGKGVSLSKASRDFWQAVGHLVRPHPGRG